MKKILNILIIFVIFIIMLLAVITAIGQTDIAILNPKGLIAQQQKELIITTIILGLIIIIPVLIGIFITILKQRENNKNAKYTPDEEKNLKYQLVWWVIPAIAVFILAIITWNATHKLDPYKPIPSTVKPIKIQVVALRWKWLFIYPEYNIATINFIKFPVNTPVIFELTADAPMNSFWIPNLGGQMYAMTGMTTKLNLIANALGDFPGYNAEISGEGFSKMRFIVKSSTNQDFENWIKSIKKTSDKLTFERYEKISQPSEDNSTHFFSSTETDLYNKIINKYMTSHDTKYNTKEDEH